MTGADSSLNGNAPLRRLVLRGGRVFDGSGADPVEDAVVVVEGERIAAVGSESQVSIDPADETIDLRPCTLLPGLIDAHVHLWGRSPGDAMPWASGPIEYRALRSASEARKLLEAGFTSVRDLGSQTSVVVKRAIDDGVVRGPRMKAAGMAIARTGGPWFGIDPSWRWVLGPRMASTSAGGRFISRSAKDRASSRSERRLPTNPAARGAKCPRTPLGRSRP